MVLKETLIRQNNDWTKVLKDYYNKHSAPVTKLEGQYLSNVFLKIRDGRDFIKHEYGEF